MTLTIMCGIPNAGKTTAANALAEETGATVIHHDAYYSRVITPTTFVSPKHLKRVTDLALADVKAALRRGEDVIYDATNDTAKARKKVLTKCKVDGCRYVCMLMATPPEVCIARDNVGWSRIFAARFEMPDASEGLDEVIVSEKGVE